MGAELEAGLEAELEDKLEDKLEAEFEADLEAELESLEAQLNFLEGNKYNIILRWPSVISSEDNLNSGFAYLQSIWYLRDLWNLWDLWNL